MNMRLMDGDKLIAELNREKEYNKKQENIQREWDLIAYISQIESGRFDIPSDQGEARLRKSVQWFAEQMESQLAQNDHKSGWIDESREFLLSRLEANYHALYAKLQAYGSCFDAEGTIRKSTNIANFAMMIADNSRKLLPGIAEGGNSDE